MCSYVQTLDGALADCVTITPMPDRNTQSSKVSPYSVVRVPVVDQESTSVGMLVSESMSEPCVCRSVDRTSLPEFEQMPALSALVCTTLRGNKRFKVLFPVYLNVMWQTSRIPGCFRDLIRVLIDTQLCWDIGMRTVRKYPAPR
jgi:hypothetical protein